MVLAVAMFVAALTFTSSNVGLETRSLVDGLPISYGSAPSAFGRLWLPASDDAPVVVLVHGGFWQRRGGDLSLMTPLAEFLQAEGFAVWNIEYGRVGEARGGWPYTFGHVAAGVDHLATLADEYAIDADRVSVVGHSAGGHLALWVSGRRALVAGDPGTDPRVEPTLFVALAPVVDLVAASEDGLGNGAVPKLLGGSPNAVSDRFRVASPPLLTESVHIILGRDDDTVPERYAIPPSSDASIIRLTGVDHLGLINPEGAAGSQILQILSEWAGNGNRRTS